MLVTPKMLKEQLVGNVNSLVKKSRLENIILEHPVAVTSFNILEKLKLESSPSIVSIFKQDKNVFHIVCETRAKKQSHSFDTNEFNIEDLYSLQYELSKLISPSPSINYDLNEELW